MHSPCAPPTAHRMPMSSILRAALLAAALLAPDVSRSAPLLRATERADALHLDVRSHSSTTSEVNRRPTGPEGPYGMNYGDAPPLHHDAGPAVRIWYAAEGPHGVPPEDLDGSGVPDFVELLATQLHEITARFAADGWNTPLTDVGRGLPDFGDDGRFDVYLLDFSQHFGSSADGFLVTEFCEGAEGRECGGYIVIENDFEGFHYPSIPDAVRTLFSHEYAHAVGASYATGASTWWDEGQATWAEYAYADVEHDVIRLASRWFSAPDRPLDDPAGPGEGWSYAGSTFVLHLAEVHGSQVIRRTWEALADGTARTAVGALDAALIEQNGSALNAWSRFVEAAWFTGDRLAPADITPIPYAEALPQLSPRSIRVDALPYRYVSPKWSADPVRLEGLLSLAGTLVLRPCEAGVPVQSVLVFDPDTHTPHTLSPTDAPFRPAAQSVFTFLGTPRRSAEHCVMLYDAEDAPPLCEGASCDPPEDDGDCDDQTHQDGGCEPPCEDRECEPEPEPQTPAPPATEGGGCAAAPAPGAWFGIAVMVMALRRRRGSAGSGA